MQKHLLQNFSTSKLLKNTILVFFATRQARSEASRGSQNNDLRRYFGPNLE